MNEPLDEHMDIARMGYSDMLNDDERNRAYDIAIRICVSTLVKERNPTNNKFFHCLDIGTGSGLLSMMIVRAFKELDYLGFHVTALEESKTMARTAARVIARNAMSDFITVVPKSCQQFDRPSHKFNLLVAELLDTELIGEGCLHVYQDAVKHLCDPDCLFVPHIARIYIEPVASNLLFKRHAIDDLEYDLTQRKKIKIEVSPNVRSCCDCRADDMQVSMLQPEKDFIRISEPKQVFSFQFNQMSKLEERDTAAVTFPIKRSIDQPPMLIMWWDLVMYDRDKTTIEYVRDVVDPEMPLQVLSCAPNWAKNELELNKDQAILRLYGREVWRDHWLQSVHYFGDIEKTKHLMGSDDNETLTIYATRDTLSFWFDLTEYKYSIQTVCSCGVHRMLSRNQLAFLSDEQDMVKLLKSTFYGVKASHAKLQFIIRNYYVTKEEIGVSIEDLPKWEIRLDSSVSGQPMNRVLIDLNINEDIPWKKVLSRSIKSLDIFPIDYLVIKCAQVRFDNLLRIRTNIGMCEGFNLEDLDEVLNFSSRFADKKTESFYLWEYGCKRLDEDYVITSSEIIAPETRTMSGLSWERIRLPIKRNWKLWHSGWALVFWADFHLLNTNEVISTGPIEECAINERIKWNRHFKQVVYFMNDHPIPDSGDQSSIELDVGIDANGDFTVQRTIDYNTVPLKPDLYQ